MVGVAIIVIVALLVSGLRLVMPYMNHYRASLLHSLSSMVARPIDASVLHGQWANFGPMLEARDVSVGLKDGGTLRIDRVTLALDIWQSLLHARWQFRDLTFWQLRLTTNTPLFDSEKQNNTFKVDQLNDLFFRQFDHFDLRDSQISFLTPSGQRAELAIPKLTWLNEKKRHRAQGEVSLSSLTGQHGVVQVRLDLGDENGLLDTGRIWMQADDVDVKPWLGQWMRDNTTLKRAHFSLAAWVSLQEGNIYDGDIWLKKGGGSWQGDQQEHSLEVDNLTAHLARFNGGWMMRVPQTRLRTDGKAWPSGHFSLLWQQADDGSLGPDHNQELRLRATQLDLQLLTPLMPLFSHLPPQLLDNWRGLQPRGLLQALALDIPLKQPEQTRFQAQWQNLNWQHWRALPAMEHVNGRLFGSMKQGRLDVNLSHNSVDGGTFFRAPLDIDHATGTLDWKNSDEGLMLSGKQIDINARSLWVRGDFGFSQAKNKPPRLDILAGINVTNAGDAWRYFPEPLMGHALTEYLSGAIKGGEVENATLLFAGNPEQFPFKHNEGMFEVSVPLRKATYAFQPGWPSINDLAIDLDFINDGLWMQAPQAMLGKVQANNISAVIPDYLKEKLIIDGDISGDGQDIADYFAQTPLKPTLGAALMDLQIGGNTQGHLKLDIPLNGKQVRASGDVALKDNRLFIKPINVTLAQLSGHFRYDNGNLTSDELQANWLAQPITVAFNTQENPTDYKIGVALQGHWQPEKLTMMPAEITRNVSGNLAWQSQLDITLPNKGSVQYEANLNGDLKEVSSHLPSPLDKRSGQAMAVSVNAKGDLNHVDLSGVVGNQHRFNSRWLPGKQLRLDRGIWVNDSKTLPGLPQTPGMILNLPPLDGNAWLELLAGASGGKGEMAYLPGAITLRTPMLTLAGQQWHTIDATLSQTISGGMQVQLNGHEIKGTLSMPGNAPWLAHLKYLYYNPQWQTNALLATSSVPAERSDITFSRWPSLQLTCDECWLRGQNFGRMRADLTPHNDTLVLTNGQVETASSHLTINGEWVNRPGEQRTSLKGKLSGDNINHATNWFGVNTPLRDAPFAIEYDLHWRSAPWQPSESTLSGVLKSHFGKGQIADVSTGRAGQLLRLFSFDALLRKLRFDFNDTFGEGFYFDSINGTAWINEGVIRTDNLLVDGLEADIAMKGKVDLVQRQIDMEAVVAPEISATVGVAAAFVVNPVVGAAMFAASQVLGPLWNKISVLRYHISGPIDKPEINEVLRKPREKSAK